MLPAWDGIGGHNTSVDCHANFPEADADAALVSLCLSLFTAWCHGRLMSVYSLHSLPGPSLDHCRPVSPHTSPTACLLITGEGRTWATVSWHTAHTSHYNYWLYLQQLLRCYHWLFWTKLHFSLSAHVISYRSGPAQVFSPRPSQQNWQAARAQHWPATARPASTSGAESRPGPSSYHLETMFGLAPWSQVNNGLKCIIRLTDNFIFITSWGWHLDIFRVNLKILTTRYWPLNLHKLHVSSQDWAGCNVGCWGSGEEPSRVL